MYLNFNIITKTKTCKHKESNMGEKCLFIGLKLIKLVFCQCLWRKFPFNSKCSEHS